MCQILFEKSSSGIFWVRTYCTDLRYPWFGPKMHIFGCRLHNYSQSKGIFFMANLKNLVQADSLALLNFFWGIKIARMTTFRTWRIFVGRSSKNQGFKFMILNVKIHCKEVFSNVRYWSFDKKTMLCHSNIGIRCSNFFVKKLFRWLFGCVPTARTWGTPHSDQKCISLAADYTTPLKAKVYFLWQIWKF